MLSNAFAGSTQFPASCGFPLLGSALSAAASYATEKHFAVSSASRQSGRLQGGYEFNFARLVYQVTAGAIGHVGKSIGLKRNHTFAWLATPFRC